MNKNANPLEAIIDFAWASGADLFFVQNAKDELKKLREKNKEWVKEAYRANEFAVEQTNEYLEVCQQMQALKDSLEHPVAWARINDNGDLFDLRLQNNPYINQDTVVPLFRLKP
jgi:hypothetical protein